MNHASSLGAGEMRSYLETLSDFAFELQVLNVLRCKGCRCEHGGSYDDPKTDKPRQFDIRAQWSSGARLVYLAVECKNIRPDRPLLVLRVPRRETEAYHDVLISAPSADSTSSAAPQEVLARPVRMSRLDSIFAIGAHVGKSCAQVCYQKGSLSGSDSDVYDKWAQALSSARDLVDRAVRVPRERAGAYYFSAVMPLLVVPNDTLWVADYDSDGNLLTDPRLEDQTSYFVNRVYQTSDRISYQVSHLEFMTLGGLQQRLDEPAAERFLTSLFADRAVHMYLQRLKDGIA